MFHTHGIDRNLAQSGKSGAIIQRKVQSVVRNHWYPTVLSENGNAALNLIFRDARKSPPRSPSVCDKHVRATALSAPAADKNISMLSVGEIGKALFKFQNRGNYDRMLILFVAFLCIS